MMRFLLSLLLCALAPVWAKGSDFGYRGGNLLVGERALAKLRVAHGGGSIHPVEGGEGVRLERPAAKGGATFTLTIPVEKGAEYLLRFKVRSEASVVARLGGLTMAYNDLGQWQTVAGLYRATDSLVVLELTLSALAPGGAAAAELQGLSMVRVERPGRIGRRTTSGTTPLVEGGKAQAAIVIPAGQARYVELAASINEGLRKRTGVSLPVLTDREATAADYPTLLPEHRGRHLIVLGRLGNNRALWPAYNHFLTAVDRFYPGGDGYALHTAANVGNRGGNHLVIGGSSDKGVERGTERFLQQLAKAEAGEGGLRLPWLLETDLQGACLATFREDDALWRNDPESPLLPKREPGYGNVVRWYHNAMGYYRTGWPSYRERAREDLARVLHERAYTHHYIAEFFVRIFDMLDESGTLPPEQVAAVDALLLENFLDVQTLHELRWMTTFAPPYGQIGLTSRHQIAPWMADWKLAQWVSGTLTPEGGLRDLATFRREEKERALRNFVAHRNNPSLPGGGLDEVYEEVNASFFRFALEKELYREFFGSGNARKALALERVDHVSGRFAYPPRSRDTRLPLGILASLTGEPGLYWLWKNLPEEKRPTGYFQNRYLGPVGRYNPEPKPGPPPDEGGGIVFAPDPVSNAPLRATRENYFFLALRGGFGRKDDYLALNGVEGTAPSGAVVSLIANGVAWVQTRPRNGASRFHSNTATAVRADGALSRGGATVSRCLWSADLPTGRAVRLRQMLSSEVEWTRDIIRLRNGLFVFRDAFTAQQAGTYLLGVNWALQGQLSREDGAYRFNAGGGRLQLRMGGAGFEAMESQGPLGRHLHYQSLRRLGVGESAVAYTVVESPGAKAFEPVAFPEGGGVVIGPEAAPWRLEWGGQAPLSITTAEATGHYPALTPGGIPRAPVAKASLPGAGAGELRIGITSTPWRKAWSYGGMLQPARVSSLTFGPDGVADLGERLELAEIRALPSGVEMLEGRLPQTVQAADTPEGEWRELKGERRWRPGVRTGNYGEAHPVARLDEAFFPPRGTFARYLKAGPAALVFTHSRQEARHPLRLETGDFLSTGEPQTLVVSDIFPQFPRAFRQDDFSVALLDARGKALFHKTFTHPVQAARLLDREGNGQKELFILRADGKLAIYGLDGGLRAEADLYAMHQEFAAAYRERKTRVPAGGHVLPFSIGLWRPEGEGAREVVVGRYGGFTFLNPDLSFKGVLYAAGYGTPGLLPEGANFGRGKGEEQVVAERQRLWLLGGSGKPTARTPGGPQFWKQAHEVLHSVTEGRDQGTPLSGAPILRFELLAGVSETPRYVLLARGGALTLYDAQRQAFAYRWASGAPMKGVAILEQTATCLRLLVATADFLLWELEWREGLAKPPRVHTRLFPAPVSSLCEGGGGSALLAGPEGLYRISPQGEATQIAEGAYRTVAPLRTGSQEEVVAATELGEVISLRPAR